nr:putative ribonuclease H-like domain-containing protein [Ipomoea batatas]
MLRLDTRRHGHIGNILERCRTEAQSFQQISFLHVFREQNKVADFLAKNAHRQRSGIHHLMDPPLDIRDKLYEDQIGASFYRRIPRNRSIVSV